MNDIDRTAHLAQYKSHGDMGMAGYESDMDRRQPRLVSPRHAMRMDELPLSARLRHMTAREMLRAALWCVALIVMMKLLMVILWVMYDVQMYGLFG